MGRCLSSFTDIILNEKMLYDFFCQNNGCYDILQHTFPLKMFKTTNYVKQHRVFFKTMFFLLDHVFWGMICFYFLKKMVFYSQKKLWKREKTIKISGSIILYYSSMLPSIIQKTNLAEHVENCTVLKYPDSLADLPGAKQQVTLIQAASYKDLFKAFCLACHEITSVRKTYGKEATYHALKAYDVHLTRLILENNSDISQIIYGNMADRWACLFSHMEGFEKILIQHGIIGRVPSNIPPGILGSIDILYLLSDKYLPYFTHCTNSIGSVQKIKSNFTPFPCKKCDGMITILLIANPAVNFQKEKQVLELLTEYRDKFDIYLKPHPRYSFSPYYELQKDYNFRLIEDKGYFPATDAVISYESTLAWEYESCNVPVFYYDHMAAEEIIDNVKVIYAKNQS